MDKDITISKEEQPLMVTIRCITYNHEPYIRQCLEGFVMQKTNFRFEAIVHDDASTDGTAAIIREYAEKYPDIIKPIYETENQYSKHDGSLRRIMDAHMHGKYIALCEGDDYWIDPLKLQKQVDFLEENPEYGMVHTDFRVLHNETNVMFYNGSRKYKIAEGDVFEELFRGCWIRTLTVCVRSELIKNLPQLPLGAFSGDLYYFYEIAMRSKVHFMNYESGVYRLLQNSASHISNEATLYNVSNSYRMLDYFYAERGNISEKTLYLLDKKWFVWNIKYWLRNGCYEKFIQLENKGYLSFKRGEYCLNFVYKLSHIKLFFILFSFIMRWKLYLLRKFKK